MFEIGNQVSILDPFKPFFPDTYVITQIDGTTAWLENVESAFDFAYLQKVT